MITITDNFDRANGTLGSIPSTSLAWEAVAGTWDIYSNRIRLATASAATTMALVDPSSYYIPGQSCDTDISIDLSYQAGHSLYARALDVNNWVRLRERQWQSSYQYYPTEYEYNYYEWWDWYEPRNIQYYWENKYQEAEYSQTTAASCSYGQWSGWSLESTTACRIDAPAAKATVYNTNSGTNCGGAIRQYRVVANPLGQGCAADKRTYRHEYQTRSVTYTPSSTTYTWSAIGLGSPWTPTGNTRTVSQGTFYWATTKDSPYDTTDGTFRYVNNGANYAKVGTASTKSTNANGAYDLYLNTTATTISTYWATSPQYSSTRPTDTPTGASRTATYTQTGYNDEYEILLEKCVAGTVTQIGTSYNGYASSLRLVCVGTSIYGYVNGGGSAVVSGTVTEHTTNPKVGVGGAVSTTYDSYGFWGDNFTLKILSHPVTSSDTATISATDTSALMGTNYLGASDSGSISVAETSSILSSLSRTDGGSLSVSDTSSHFRTASQSEAVSLSVSETVSMFKVVDVSDNGSLSVSDGSAQVSTIVRTDTASISVSDVTTLFITKPTSDTASIAVSETTNSFRATDVSDTASISVTESNGRFNTNPGSETLALAITEQTSIFVTLSHADTGAVAANDTSSHQSNLTVNDTASIAASESIESNISLSRADTAAWSVNDSISGLATGNRMDGAAISVSESTTFFRTIAGIDGASLSVSETQSNFRTFGSVDNAAVSVTETSSLYTFMEIEGVDASSLAVSETNHNLKSIDVIDTQGLRVTEAVSLSSAGVTSDSGTISIGESHTIFVTISRGDEVALSVSESTQRLNSMPGAETVSIAVSENAEVEKSGLFLITGSDTGSLATTETNSRFNSLSAVDTVSLGVTEIYASNMTISRADSASIVISENVGPRAVSISRTDGAAISVSEANSQFRTITVVDSQGLVVTEAGTDTDISGKVYIYLNGQWKLGTAMIYRAGSWQQIQILTYKYGVWL